MIDLHCHSSFSDGSESPETLVAAARGLGLRALALTDHDTCAGVPVFLETVRESGGGLLGFAGVEISVETATGTLHLLGYGMDPDNRALRADLAHIRDGRDWRNRRILAALQGLGIPLEWREVVGFAGDEIVARPHFALALVARGVVKSKQQAFDRYLAKGQPAYVDRFRLTPETAIGRIANAGGVAVLAHPLTLGLGPDALRETVKSLIPHGLGGIEVYYAEHSSAQTAQLRRLAKDLGLLLTGGSDYHGTLNPDVRLGKGFGGLRVPDDLVAPLVRALSSSRGLAGR